MLEIGHLAQVLFLAGQSQTGHFPDLKYIWKIKMPFYVWTLQTVGGAAAYSKPMEFKFHMKMNEWWMRKSKNWVVRGQNGYFWCPQTETFKENDFTKP